MKDSSRKLNMPLCVIALVAGGVALIYLKSILMPLVVAFFLVNLAGPFLTFLKNKGTPSGFAILAIILLTALTIFLLANIFYSQVPALIQDAPKYEKILVEKYRSFNESLPEKVRGYFDLTDTDWNEVLKWGARQLKSTLGSLFSILGTLFLIVIYMIFLFPERENFIFRVKQAYDREEGGRILNAIETIQKQTENYVVGKTLISLATGLLFTVVLWIFGVRFFFVWGLLAFMLNFIPNIGSCIATAAPLLVAFAQTAMGRPEGSFSLGTIGLLALCLVAIQITVGSLLEPKLLGERLQLSPLVVFLAFITWGWLWGLPGIILSVPITATLKIIFENVDSLKPLSILISNRSEGAKK